MKIKQEEAIAFFKKEKFIIKEKKLNSIITAVKLGLPILAVGPTGSGKTLFFSLLAKMLGGTYHYQSLNGSITISDLTQERILGNKGQFETRDMILANWLRDAEKGISVLQFDEINAAKAETLLAMHPIMDIKGELFLPFSKETLKVDKDKAVFVMSCNEGDEYEGTNAMNMAFQNRYIKIHFPYIQGDELAKHLTDKTGVPIEHTRKIVSVWEKYMASRDPEQPVVGIRMLEYWCMMSKDLGLRIAGEYTFAGLIAKNEDELASILEGDFFINLPN